MFEPSPISLVVLSVLGVASLIATVTDIWKFRVYNALTFPLMVSGLIFHGCLPNGSGILFSIAGLFFGGGLLIAFYAMGGVGAGDVKLLAGLGAWLGITNTLGVFLSGSLFMGVWIVVVLAFRKTLMLKVIQAQTVFERLVDLGWLIGKDCGEKESLEEMSEGHGRYGRVVPFAVTPLCGLVVMTLTYWK